MTTINNELSKRLQQLEEDQATLIKNLLNDLVNANTILEQEKAKDRFKNEVSKFVREKE